VTAFDLDDFWHATLPKAAAGPAEQARHFKMLVKSEFVFMLKELFESARADLRRQIEASLRRLRFMTYSAVYPFIEQLQQIAAHYRGMMQEQRPGEPADKELGEILERWRGDIAAYEKLAAQLRTHMKQCFLIAAG
jgi:hypothetical protein